MGETEPRLRVGLRTNTLSDERLQYIRQLGVRDVFINPVEPGGDTGGDIFEDESDRTETDRRLPLGPDDDSVLNREYTEAELWESYEAFLEEVLSVAERAGVTLVEVGFDGIVIPDHVPEMCDDTDWGHRARVTGRSVRGDDIVLPGEPQPVVWTEARSRISSFTTCCSSDSSW